MSGVKGHQDGNTLTEFNLILQQMALFSLVSRNTYLLHLHWGGCSLDKMSNKHTHAHISWLITIRQVCVQLSDYHVRLWQVTNDLQCVLVTVYLYLDTCTAKWLLAGLGFESSWRRSGFLAALQWHHTGWMTWWHFHFKPLWIHDGFMKPYHDNGVSQVSRKHFFTSTRHWATYQVMWPVHWPVRMSLHPP